MLCVLYCMYVPRSLQLELSFNSCFALLFASVEVRIGETGKGTHEKIEEHGRDIRDIRLSRTQTSTVSEHTNKIGHYPLWNGVRVSDRDLNWYSVEELKKLC